MRAAGEDADGEGRVRAGHVRQRVGRTDRRTARGADQAGRSRGEAGRNGGAQGRARARRKRSSRGEARQAGELDHARALQGGPRDAGAPVRADGAAEPRRRELRLDARVRLEQAGGHAEGTLRLPVPEPRSGLDLGAAEGGPERTRAHAHDRAGPRGGGDEAVAPAARGELSGDGRAGDRRRPDGRDHAFDRAAAGGGRAGDGTRPQPDLPGAATALAAGGRAARRRAHVRRAVGRGRLADGRLDRGAAGARGFGRGLRDSVPVARGGGVCGRGPPAAGRAGGRAARGDRGRADDRDGRDREHRRDARAAALAGADGARLRVAAGGGRRDRLSLRADGGLGRARAGRSRVLPKARCARGRSRSVRGGRERSVHTRSREPRHEPGSRLAGGARAAAGQPGQSLRGAGGADRGSAPAGTRALRGPGAGGARLGPGYADARGDEHRKVGPAEPRIAAEPRRARARHRRRRAARSDGQREGSGEAGDDRMDELVRERDAEALRLQRSAGLRPIDDRWDRDRQARLCPAFSLPDLFSGATASAGTGAAATDGSSAQSGGASAQGSSARDRAAPAARRAARSSRRPTSTVCSTRSRRISPRT